jgi:hypothetical protein
MKLLKNVNEIKPDFGDFHFGDTSEYVKYLNKFDKNLELDPAVNTVPINLIKGGNPIIILDSIGIGKELLGAWGKYSDFLKDIDGVSKDSHAVVPFMILTRDVSPYIKDKPEHLKKMISDVSWNRSQYWDEYAFEQSLYSTILMGSRNDMGCNPCDGCSEVVVYALNVDNGDQILCHVIEWFNQ